MEWQDSHRGRGWEELANIRDEFRPRLRLTADLDGRQHRVTVTLVSRAARGLTLAVFDLARAIDNRD